MQKLLAIKLGVITAIGLMLVIPLAMIDNKIDERRQFQHMARDNTARSWTGRQTLITPILVQTYRVRVNRQTGVTTSGAPIHEQVTETRHRYLIPERVELELQVQTQRRRQGIYDIPVYTAAIHIAGAFGRERLQAFQADPPGEDIVIGADAPVVALSVADMRGIEGAPALLWEGERREFAPNAGAAGFASGIHAPLPDRGAPSDGTFSVDLELRGMEAFHLVPAGKDVAAAMTANWPHPKFSGAFLPQTYTVNNRGFEAQWRLNHFSTGIEQRLQHCWQSGCGEVDSLAFGVDFIEAVDTYLQSERSAKYGILFVGLSFVAFFIFEVLRGIAIHPLQYALVGFALAVFFLLLISLSEHLGFALAYVIASAACLTLLAYYVRFVLRGWRETAGFVAGLAALYGLLYVIVRAEDFALLMGSVLVFAVLAGVMVLTRDVDWYAVATSSKAQKR